MYCCELQRIYIKFGTQSRSVNVKKITTVPNLGISSRLAWNLDIFQARQTEITRLEKLKNNVYWTHWAYAHQTW